MIDQVRIFVKAGDGGSGCDSFKGKKFTRFRRPDGGSGGGGGDVIIRVDKSIQGLEHFQFKQHFRAANGKGGQANKKKGASARPCIINVPPGTIVRDLKSNLLLGDLTDGGEELLATKGGAGGRANSKANPAGPGLSGEEKTLCLELKIVAEVAIVGYPNSGKSTLLAQITSAKPKIAGYPFTTRSAFLGVLTFKDFKEPASLTCVEIPGLINGSRQGKGLGSQFLRHAERAAVLIHLIDIAPAQQRTPFEDYSNLNQELKYYSPQLAQKPQILAANKMDLAQAGANLSNFSQQLKQKIYPISALKGTGIKQLTFALREYFRKGQ